ncbi:sensor histidine kinase [Hellea sp.]|nr:sensor histidine kinase [Hellea sp.]
MLTLCHIKQIFLAFILVMLSASHAVAQSSDNYLDYSAPDAAQFSKHLEYYLDETWDRTAQDMLTDYADQFAPIQTPEPNFGYIDEKVWLRMKIHNTSPNISQWKLYVKENFLQYYDVYVQREDGRLEHLEHHDPKTKFSERKYVFPELVTQLEFSPDEKITILINYWSGGSSHASISLETENSFSSQAYVRTSKNYISYGMMIILLIAASIGFLILRQRVFSAYIGYVFVTLLFLIHSDGVAFQFLWPQFPTFNSYFSIIVGCAFVMVTYNFARVFLQTNIYEPRIDRILKTLCYATPFIMVLGAIIDPQLTKKFIFIQILIAITAGTLAGLNAARTRFKAVRFYLIAWVLGIGISALMNMRHTLGISIPQEFVFDSVRLSIIVDAIMMGLGIGDHYLQTLQSRREASDQTLAETEKNLRLSTRLYDLEQQFQLATELVATRDESFQSTVHDLRQPLHALRLNVQGLREGNSDGGEGDIDDTFDYLETLIAGHLQKSMSKNDAPTADEGAAELSLSKILNSIYDMFLPDAQEKGLEFRYVETSQNTHIKPIVLMRIITNLVSNAIKYTPSGKVLLGVRRHGGILRIEVHDTGLGMNAEEFESARTQAVRLYKNDETGHGLGLAIVDKLAEENGCKLMRLDRQQAGTSLALVIPKNDE